jgi:3-methyl-2-oxobutanoate hydroxymethyltransferase
MANTLYGAARTRRVTVTDLQAAKARGERWPMITSYDAMSARVFDDAGIPVLLVGDSAAMVVRLRTPRASSRKQVRRR